MDKTREKGIDGNPCVPIFLLDPSQLKSLRKPIRKIARPKPPPLFTGLREKEREMVARRLLLQHVYGTNFGRDSCDKLAVLLEKQQEINSTRPSIPDAPNHSTYVHYPPNAYQKRKEYQYTKLLKAATVFDPQRDEVYIGPTFRTQPPPNYPSRRFTPSNTIGRPSRSSPSNLRPRSRHPRPLTCAVPDGAKPAPRSIDLMVPEANKQMPWFSNADKPGAMGTSVRPGFKRSPTKTSTPTDAEKVTKPSRRSRAARSGARGRKRGLPWSVLKMLHEV